MVAKHVGVSSLHGFLDFGAVFHVVRTEAFLADLEVVVAFLAENVVVEQSNMGAYFVSVFRCNMRRSPPCHCTPNIGCCFSCLHVQSEVVMFMSVCPHWIDYATEFG